MAFPSPYHAESDADDEFERDGISSPTHMHDDSEESSEPSSNEHTPTFSKPGYKDGLPDTIITEWTPEDCAQFVAGFGLLQYGELFIEHGIVGEALVALKHDELKEMGIASVGHRLTILKHVYDVKIDQDIPLEPDDYVPPTAETNPLHEMATKEDITRLVKAMTRLRDERIVQVEAQLTRLADDYRKLRQELLPVFKMSKERSEPLPYAPYQTSSASPDIYQQDITSAPMTQPTQEKSSLSRTFSKKLGLSSTPKNNSPTHIPNTIHEGRSVTDSLDPSAAATAASNQLTAQMSGGSFPQHSPSTNNLPSPTSPMPYHSLAPRSYQGDTTALPRYDGSEDISRSIPTPTPPMTQDPPTSAKSVGKPTTNSTMSNASTLIPSRAQSASVPPQFMSGSGSSTTTPPSHRERSDEPSVEIFKSFRVGLEDPCYKVLPAALRKYHIQADWRQYSLFIVYGDQERCVGLEEKPLALFKDLDKEGKKPMFMLRKLANPIPVEMNVNGSLKPLGMSSGAMGSGGLNSSSTSVRGMAQTGNLPGGII